MPVGLSLKFSDDVNERHAKFCQTSFLEHSAKTERETRKIEMKKKKRNRPYKFFSFLILSFDSL